MNVPTRSLTTGTKLDVPVVDRTITAGTIRSGVMATGDLRRNSVHVSLRTCPRMLMEAVYPGIGYIL